MPMPLKYSQDMIRSSRAAAMPSSEATEGRETGRADPSRALRTIACAAVLGIALSVAACSAAQTDDRCIAAFRNVDLRALPEYGASPLDDAIRVCSDLAQWRRVWDTMPAAHPGRDDALGFLVGRCANEVLSATQLCRQVAQPGS